MILKIIEEWRPVPGYEGLYEASNTGKVASLNYNGTGARHELKPVEAHHGYQRVRLYKDGKWKSVRVHRVIAETFIPNESNLPEINHIDENPANNAVTNLEWCTHKHNCNHGTRRERHSKQMTNNAKLSKAVIAILPDGTTEVYPSQGEAARQLNCSQGRISDACRGVIPTYHHGRRWAYAD